MTLPIHEIADEFKQAIRVRNRARVLVKAPTGSGKSTEIPGMILDAGIEGMILVIEPRRMAARMLAEWVSQKRRSILGQEVGYSVRFDRMYEEDSQIVFLTDGVFQRWLQSDPNLTGVGAVVFDEFHERRLAVDMTLARCLDLQDAVRSDLRLAVMSATLETRGLAEYLSPAVSLEAGGRTYPVEIHYRASQPTVDHRRGGPPREQPVWEKMVRTCVEAMLMPEPGNILMFLPGVHEIRKTIELLERGSTCQGWDIFPLYGALPPAAQNAAVRPGDKPKIIVATNVAETSLTIDGVRTVIDSGLARISSFESRRGINTLLIKRISRASAEQRAGRAGRTTPGRAFRIWSQGDHGRREEFDAPEVHRIDLSEASLLLRSAGIRDIAAFRWFDAPQPEALGRADQLLHDLGAIDAEGLLTERGTQMAKLPLEPRFARLFLAGHEYGCLAEAAFIACAVQGEGIFTRKRGGVGRKDFIFPGDHSDFCGEFRAYDTAGEFDFEPQRCGQVGILARGAREIRQGMERLKRLAVGFGWDWNPISFEKHSEGIGRAMLAAFSDHLGMRFNPHTLACRLVGKRRGKLDEDSCVQTADAFVATEITEVEGREVITHLRRATAVELAWINEEFPEGFHESESTVWDDSRRRAIHRKQKQFRDLVIESSDSDHEVNLDDAAELLAERIMEGDLILKNWNHEVDQWTIRLSLLANHMPELELPDWTEEEKGYAIAQICHGSVSYKQIKEAPVWPILNNWLRQEQRMALDSYCPSRIVLTNGQSAKINYQVDKDPWISVRVCLLFGVWDTPVICDSRVPLLVHILTPGQKPWQMTKDLGSFWNSGYHQMRKELAGRYPKHPWPEDPREALPPTKRK